MNNYNIAIIITTFLRDTLLYKCLQAIVDNYTNNCIVLIADQGYSTDEKNITLDFYKSQIPLEYYRLPFDSGLSYARNFLVNKAHEMSIPYVLIAADSIHFINPYNFQPFITFLEQDSKRGIVGFDLIGSKCPWEFNMEVNPTGIKMLTSSSYTEFEGIKYKKIDICRNIFLAKTNHILNLWDSDMKLCEHELAFLELKKRNIYAFWTDALQFKHINSNTSDEYKSYRDRFKDFQKLLRQKLNINGWVSYSPEAMREIKEYKLKHS